jgi:peptide-methionine (R)-S-oxide reductase
MAQKTTAEWKAELSTEQYRVLRRKGTQAAGTGEYDDFFVSSIY